MPRIIAGDIRVIKIKGRTIQAMNNTDFNLTAGPGVTSEDADNITGGGEPTQLLRTHIGIFEGTFKIDIEDYNFLKDIQNNGEEVSVTCGTSDGRFWQGSMYFVGDPLVYNNNSVELPFKMHGTIRPE